MTLPPFKHFPYYFYIGAQGNDIVPNTLPYHLHISKFDIPWYLEETIRNSKFSPLFISYLVHVSKDFISRLLRGRNELNLKLFKVIQKGPHEEIKQQRMYSYGGMDHMSFVSLRRESLMEQNDFNSIQELQKLKSKIPRLNSSKLIEYVESCLNDILKSKTIETKKIKKAKVWMLGGNSRMLCFPQSLLLDLDNQWSPSMIEYAVCNITKILLLDGAEEETNAPRFNRMVLPTDASTLVIMNRSRFKQKNFIFPNETLVLDQISEEKLFSLSELLNRAIIHPSEILERHKISTQTKSFSKLNTVPESISKTLDSKKDSQENIDSLSKRWQSLLIHVEQYNYNFIREEIYDPHFLYEIPKNEINTNANNTTTYNNSETETNEFKNESLLNDKKFEHSSKISPFEIIHSSNINIINLGKKSFLIIPTENIDATYVVQSFSPWIAEDIKSDILHDYIIDSVEICEGLGGGTLEIALFNSIKKLSQTISNPSEKEILEAFAESLLLIPQILIKCSNFISQDSELLHEMKRSFQEERYQSLGFNFETSSLTETIEHKLKENLTLKRELYRLICETAVVATRGVRLQA